MSYSRELYAKAYAELEEIRRENEGALARRTAAVYARLPRVRDIDAEIQGIGLEIIALAAGAGGNLPAKLKELRRKQKTLNIERKTALLENGIPEEALEKRYECGACQDTGAVGTKRCDCMQKRLTRLAFAESNLSARLQNQTFDKFRLDCYPAENNARDLARVALDDAKRFVAAFDAPGKSLLFLGKPGLGKTFLSSCIANDLLSRGKSVIYQTAYSIFSILEDYKFKKRADLEKIALQVERLYDCDLLILDDLGAEFTTPYSSAAFFDIVNTRLVADKKTVLNSNLTLAEICDNYHPRVVSRILGHYGQIELRGGDVRQALANL
jgi:DNA replication protein DnaC